MNAPFRTLGFSDFLPFGQYKGCTVRDVCERDAPYLKWVMEQGKVSLKSDVVERVRELSAPIVQPGESYGRVYSAKEIGWLGDE